MNNFYPYYFFDSSCQIPFLDEIYQRCFGKISGFVVDVGAFDGHTCSNTSGLIRRGWQALMIEPVSEHFEKLKNLYSNSTNVLMRNVAIGSECGEATIHLAGALSTINVDVLEEYSQIDWAKSNLTGKRELIDISTLDYELDHFFPGKRIDVLNIDTEGYEYQVLAGFDVERHKPRMVIIELSDFHPHLKSTNLSNKDIYLRFIRCGYVVIYKDAINTVFLLSELYDSII